MEQSRPFLAAVRGEVGVHRGRVDVRVPEGFLDELDIGALLPESVREGMPEHVGMDRAADDRRHLATDEAEDCFGEQGWPARRTRCPSALYPVIAYRRARTL